MLSYVLCDQCTFHPLWRNEELMLSLLAFLSCFYNVQPLISCFKTAFLFLKPDTNKWVRTTKSQRLYPHWNVRILYPADWEQQIVWHQPWLLICFPGLLIHVAGGFEKNWLQSELTSNSLQTEGLYNGLIFNN